MLNEAQRKTVEQRLLKERDEVLGSIGAHQAQTEELRDQVGDLSGYPQHPADMGTEAHEQEKDFMLASVEGRRLQDIDDALDRLYNAPEDFGRCAECGGDIEAERMEMIPETRICAAHARAAEEASGMAEGADAREAWRDPGTER